MTSCKGEGEEWCDGVSWEVYNCKFYVIEEGERGLKNTPICVTWSVNIPISTDQIFVASPDLARFCFDKKSSTFFSWTAKHQNKLTF
jgi:hypothetical protein